MSYIKKSPWLVHYDGSSCNGCDIEVLACLTPLYDVERFGIVNTGNPKHADIFLVTGGVNTQNLPVVKQIYEQIPEPKVVIAVGTCACSGGVFRDCYNMLGGMDKAIPVDVYVPGCAARPESIIDGVVKGLSVLEEKQKALAVPVTGLCGPAGIHYRRRGERPVCAGRKAESAGSSCDRKTGSAGKRIRTGSGYQ